MQAVKLCTNKILPEVLNWRCRTTQVDLYNGRKPVVVVAVHQGCRDADSDFYYTGLQFEEKGNLAEDLERSNANVAGKSTLRRQIPNSKVRCCTMIMSRLHPVIVPVITVKPMV